MDLTGVIALSRRYGSNPELVLAGGGNTSVKDQDTLYVKCSGTQLATIDEDGFVPIDRLKLAETMTKPYPEDDKGREAAFLADMMAARTIKGETRRPSVEALLHSLFPQKYILHLHPAMINGLTCAVEGEAKAKSLFGEEAIWIPATRPGYILGKMCYEAMNDYRARTGKDVKVVLLQNHGIFVAGDTPEETGQVLEGVMNTLDAEVRDRPDFTPKGEVQPEVLEFIKKETDAKHIRFDSFAEILSFAESKDKAETLLKPFTPDHIVYCGAWPTYLEKAEDIKSKALGGKIILLKGVGFFALGQTEKEAETAVLLFRDAVKIAVYAKNFGGPLHMTDELTSFILNWEAESYRKKQS